MENSEKDGEALIPELETTPPRVMSEIQRFKGTISLGIGERLLSDHDSEDEEETSLMLSSEEQTDSM